MKESASDLPTTFPVGPPCLCPSHGRHRQAFRIGAALRDVLKAWARPRDCTFAKTVRPRRYRPDFGRCRNSRASSGSSRGHINARSVPDSNHAIPALTAAAETNVHSGFSMGAGCVFKSLGSRVDLRIRSFATLSSKRIPAPSWGAHSDTTRRRSRFQMAAFPPTSPVNRSDPDSSNCTEVRAAVWCLRVATGRGGGGGVCSIQLFLFEC